MSLRWGAFRDVLVHMYLEVDPRKVYEILQSHLGDLELYVEYVSRFVTEQGAD